MGPDARISSIHSGENKKGRENPSGGIQKDQKLCHRTLPSHHQNFPQKSTV
jgi:hypothetical protein